VRKQFLLQTGMGEGAAELDIRAEIQTRVDEIEQIIKGYLPAEEGWQKTIMEAMNYSILAGGKRLRPMLMSETYRLFGGKSKVIEPFMAAMEMIHTYSLVHDDLPAMDNDEYRRGKKTTHAVYGEAMGILAGDALLNYAFETAAKAFDMEPDNRNIGKAIQILATKAGIYGMVGGQVVDVQSEDSGDITKEKLDFIYRLKTGAAAQTGCTDARKRPIPLTGDPRLRIIQTVRTCRQARQRFGGNSEHGGIFSGSSAGNRRTG